MIKKRRKKPGEKPSSAPATVPAESSRRRRGGGLDEDASLTNREREVLRLFAAGMGTEAIGGRLGITRVTVRNHSQRILAKLRVHSRLAAVAQGYREGLIERDADYLRSSDPR